MLWCPLPAAVGREPPTCLGCWSAAAGAARITYRSPTATAVAAGTEGAHQLGEARTEGVTHRGMFPHRIAPIQTTRAHPAISPQLAPRVAPSPGAYTTRSRTHARRPPPTTAEAIAPRATSKIEPSRGCFVVPRWHQNQLAKIGVRAAERLRYSPPLVALNHTIICTSSAGVGDAPRLRAANIAHGALRT
jgi:hypothetical protein